MKLGEYCDNVFYKIMQCKRTSDVINLLQEVEQVINSSEINLSSKREFWVVLYERLKQLIIEQSGSELSAIIAAAQEVILKNISKTGK